MENTEAVAAPPSQFVSFVAWCGIGLSAVFIPVFAGQVIALAAAPELIQQMLSGVIGKVNTLPLDPWLRLLADHIALVALIGSLSLAFSLTASVLLLKRIDFGRVSFIGVMVLAMPWSVLSVLIQNWRVDLQLRAMALQAKADAVATPFVHVVGTIGTIFAMLGSVIAIVLFAWIIKRLCSPQVRAEFR